MNAPIAIDQAVGLIREIEDQTDKEYRLIAEAAAQEAAAIVRLAFAKAAGRAHQAVETLRRDGERRLARARAQIETERRLRDQARAAEILHTGCPALINVVVERWRQDEARRFWIDVMAQHARKRLPPGAWVIEHPDDWTPEDEARMRKALPDDSALTFRASSEFEAGLRILTDGAILDGTPERLLADKAVTQARLLAEMSEENEAGRADEAGETGEGVAR